MSLGTGVCRGDLLVPHARAVGGSAGALEPRWLALAVLLAATGSLEPAPVFLGFAGLLAALVGARGLRVALPPLPLVAPLVGLVLLGLASTWWGGRGGEDAGVRDVLRDAWRYGAPVVLVALGWALVRHRDDLDGLLQAVLLGATLASLAHFWGALANLEQLQVGRHAFRQEVGSGSFLSALAVALVVGLRLERARPVRLPYALQKAAVVVCAASLLLSFSRTWWLACLVLVGVLLVRRAGVGRSAGLVLPLGATVAAAALLLLPEELTAAVGGGLESALTETLTARSFVEPAELNRFWRSYEAFCALDHLQRAPVGVVLAGEGLGMHLDLGLYQLLDGEYRREIPVLHNGYLEVALKAGLAGVGLYVLWLVAWVRAGVAAATRGPRARVVASLTVGLALVLVGTGQVVGGAFNPRATAGVVVLLAAFVRWSTLVRAAAHADAEGAA